MKVYTRQGDDGTTGLLFGGRVPKDSALPRAYGAVDEAQAALGMVRAESDPESELGQLVVRLAGELWVLMAELATDPANHGKLQPGVSLVTGEMVDRLETDIDHISTLFEAPTEFVVPGQTRIGALLDMARTVVRRAERVAIGAAGEGSHVVPYLNRLSDLLWTMARWQDGEVVTSRSVIT
ncbi:MAG: cob(I)yrinic acid a,c-diamide adenosyltransferase [Actinomycetia bacterium]|nr:cob(I)yrinic acid a,c-diamide adenosyltransferase [Actinomycetes bacterium]